MKVWVSKYALTRGIFEVDAEERCSEGNIFVKDKWCLKSYHKGEWHNTKEEAIKRAEKLKENKIKSLETQIQKLKEMKFE